MLKKKSKVQPKPLKKSKVHVVPYDESARIKRLVTGAKTFLADCLTDKGAQLLSASTRNKIRHAIIAVKEVAQAL